MLLLTISVVLIVIAAFAIYKHFISARKNKLGSERRKKH